MTSAAITAALEPLSQALDLLPDAMSTPEAVAMLLAIGLQESALIHRVQVSPSAPGGRGPARGLLQFEKGGGATGVLTHAASRFWMHKVCQTRGVGPTPTSLWMALEVDDVLAFAAGRLLLFTDPKRLPDLGDEQGAWNLYIRCWRPGKPHRDAWTVNYRSALAAVSEQAG
jgi:hypothetical protein